jgi:hypothetical protein
MPIKDKIFNSLEDYPQKQGIVAVFSLSDSSNLIFCEPANNITENFVKEYNSHTPSPK